jgi:hypothetical protein
VNWRCASGGLLALMAVLSAQAQTFIFNPRALWFNHPDYGITTTYRLQVYVDGSDYTGPPLYAADVPQAKALPSGDGYELRFKDMPAVPVGRTYRASLRASNGDGTSPPSNITPEIFRLNSCALAGAGTVTFPSLAVQTWPALKRGESVVLTLAIRAPHDVAFVMLDFIGDGQPSWYYVTEVAPGQPSTVQVFWGPFTRAGTFEVTGQVIDAAGCQTSLPSGTRLTVAP